MQKSQKKKLWIGILVGAIISVITLGTLLVVFGLLFLFGGPAEVHTDVSEYENTLTQYDNIHTAFIVFPEELPDSAKDTEFYFSYQDTLFDPTVEVFLQCTYDEEDYQAEILRLENTKKQYGATVRTLKKDAVERFSYPVYIAMDGYDYTYEYALLTGENQITYVYTSFMDTGSLKKVDSKYLPSDYDKRQEELTGPEGYSIYLMYVEMENGKPVAWDCDYTRDKTVDVLEYHPVTIGYNCFSVCTCLDEENREIIKNCSYSYFDSYHDAMYGLADEIEYTELEGYEFKSIELSKDETRAIVTYYDGEVEKTMEYEIPVEAK